MDWLEEDAVELPECWIRDQAYSHSFNLERKSNGTDCDV